MSTSSPTASTLPHAFMTKTSFTAMQAMVSTPLSRSFVRQLDEAREMLHRTRGREGARYREQHYLLARNSSSVEIGFGAVGAHPRELPFRHLVADFDGHCCPLLKKDVMDERLAAREGLPRRAGYYRSARRPP